MHSMTYIEISRAEFERKTDTWFDAYAAYLEHSGFNDDDALETQIRMSESSERLLKLNESATDRTASL